MKNFTLSQEGERDPEPEGRVNDGERGPMTIGHKSSMKNDV